MADKKVRVAMANEGTMFAGDGFDLSWPHNGTREVIELDALTGRIQEKVGAGSIEIVDLPVTPKKTTPEKGNLLLTGDEAREFLAIPPGAVFSVRADDEKVEIQEPEIEDSGSDSVSTEAPPAEPKVPEKPAAQTFDKDASPSRAVQNNKNTVPRKP